MVLVEHSYHLQQNHEPRSQFSCHQCLYFYASGDDGDGVFYDAFCDVSYGVCVYVEIGQFPFSSDQAITMMGSCDHWDDMDLPAPCMDNDQLYSLLSIRHLVFPKQVLLKLVHCRAIAIKEFIHR